jgi:RNA polymerase sigma-70 factor (ECF subfamily)
MRLSRALARVQPETVVVFFKLSSKLIKQELIDLCRHYLGPRGLGSNHDSNAELVAVVDRVRSMSNFHELVENLSVEDREVVDLLFYQDMTAAEAAAALEISERTVKRRWRAARLTLHRGLQDDGFFP